MPNKMVITWLNFISTQGSILSTKSRKVLQGVTQKAEEEHSGSFQTGNPPRKSRKGQCSRLSHSG